MLIIKKYLNRKFYNTETSKYINSQHVLEMFKNNVSLQVQDKNTGQDITKDTLVRAARKRLSKALTLEQLKQLV